MLLRLILWNAGFVVCLSAAIVALAVFAEQGISDTVGIWLPYIAGIWLLFLGARFSSRRASVIGIAVIACLLFLLQCAIFGFGIMLSAWNSQARTLMQLSVGAVVVTAVPFVWWYITAKLSRASARASEETARK